MAKKVADIMTRGVVSVRVDSSVQDSARAMLENDVSIVAVDDERGEICGIVSKSDILGCFGKDLDKIPVSDIMSSEIHTVSPDATLPEAVSILQVKKVHQLVIMKGDPTQKRKAIGILTIPDIIRGMANERDE